MSTKMQQEVACNVTPYFVTFFATMDKETTRLRNLGIWIKDHREKANISQEDAADLADISRYTWIRVENGQKKTTPKTLTKMAEVVKADINRTLDKAGFKGDEEFPNKPTNVRELFEILNELGLEIHFEGGMDNLEKLGEDDLQEILDSAVANASAKVKRLYGKM